MNANEENNVSPENTREEKKVVEGVEQNEVESPQEELVEEAEAVVDEDVAVEVEESVEVEEVTADDVVEEVTPEDVVEEVSVTEEIVSEETPAEEPLAVEEEKAEENQEPVAEKEQASADDIDELEDEEAEHFEASDIDIDNFSKKDFVALAERMLDAIKKPNVGMNDVRNIDSVYKEIRSAYDEIHGSEMEEAKKEYVEANGSEEGFDFRNDNYDIRFESLMIQIREQKNDFYKKLDALREDYFERKTNLLTRLREVVEEEEKGGSKENWEAFKQIQNDWRDAGNVSSPHNGSLWSAYNALLDRYFDIRSIQNELKELDRKKNLEIREGFVEKIEEIAASLKEQELTTSLLKKANEFLNEYKHTGPGPRAEQEKLWERMKAAFDIIYDKKRSQNEGNVKLMEEVFEAKSSLVEKMKPYASFASDRINDWNAKTKDVLEIQEQWNKLKGPMPRDKAKGVSKEFWSLLKDFFKGKSAFFNELEAERKKNLEAKEALCVKAEELLEAGDTSADNTNKIIALQKEWKTYGHVPQKFKDSIYKRFKKACDAFFDLKRSANSEQNKEYEENLKAKEALCQLIEDEIKSKKTDLSKLPDYKKKYAEIGFVPRKDMNKIQDRFIDAINKYVVSSGDLDKDEKEKLVLKNELEVSMNTGGSSKSLGKQEHDLRRKLRTLEDEINQLKTNIEFFGRSKGAEKIKAEYEKKIERAELEADKIKDKLKMINEVS